MLGGPRAAWIEQIVDEQSEEKPWLVEASEAHRVPKHFHSAAEGRRFPITNWSCHRGSEQMQIEVSHL